MAAVRSQYARARVIVAKMRQRRVVAANGVATERFEHRIEGLVYVQYNLWCNVPDSGSTILLMLGSVAALFGLQRIFSRQQH